MVISTVQHAAEISGIITIPALFRYEDIIWQSVKFWCEPEVTVWEFWDYSLGQENFLVKFALITVIEWGTWWIHWTAVTPVSTPWRATTPKNTITFSTDLMFGPSLSPCIPLCSAAASSVSNSVQLNCSDKRKCQKQSNNYFDPENRIQISVYICRMCSR